MSHRSSMMGRALRSRWAIPFAASAVWTLTVCAARADALVVDIDATLRNTDDPVIVSLDEGTYSVVPIGIDDGGAYDAWNPWGDTSCEEPAGCPQTVPTTVIGWKVSYDVISDAITAVSVSGSPLTPVAEEQLGNYWIASESAPDRYHVDNQTVYPSALDAHANAVASSFTVSTSGPVGFAIRDGELGDNLAGMSLLVTPVPEPSRTVLVAAGLAGLLLCSWRRRAR